MKDNLTYKQYQEALKTAKAKLSKGLITYRYYVAVKRVIKRKMREELHRIKSLEETFRGL